MELMEGSFQPSIPTQEEEFHPPSVPCASDGLLTVGMVQVPMQVPQVPVSVTAPAQALLNQLVLLVPLVPLAGFDGRSFGDVGFADVDFKLRHDSVRGEQLFGEEVIPGLL